MRRCIIGANSSLVKSVRTKLPDWSYYSHAEISDIDFNSYELVFVFSWSFLNQGDNLRLLKRIPAKKIVFISTVAVFSIHLRPQWAKYPKWKFEAEKLVLAAGGKVVRFGICDKRLLEGHFGYVPFTSVDSIVDFLNTEIFHLGKITNLFSLVGGGDSEHSIRTKFVRLAHNFSRYFPCSILFQLPFILLARIVRSPFYSYTADALIFFSENRMIGCGVLGSEYLAKNRLIGTEVLVSPKSDVTLVDGGFQGTRLGHDGAGLKKFWHGVSIVHVDGQYMKKVPFIINRSAPPSSAIEGAACSLTYDGVLFRTTIESEVDQLEVLSLRLVLAAGPVSNCSLLQDEESVVFSDHEVGLVGFIPAKSIRYFIRRVGPFCFGRKVYRSNGSSKLDFIIDFRPSVEDFSSRSDFYNDTTKNILSKIIFNFSFWRLNEAFFNKFGIGLYREKSMVFAQILSKQCISLNSDGNLSRRRLSTSELNYVLDEIQGEFPDFERVAQVHTGDGIHLVGGANLLQKDWVQQAIVEDKLTILGSPTSEQLDSLHHTSHFVEKI